VGRTAGVHFTAGAGKRYFFAITSPSTLGPTHLPIQWVLVVFSSVVKWLGRETNHIPSARVKNAWSYTFTPSYIFMMLYLVKYRDNFSIYLSSVRDSWAPKLRN
jgi:hypothetical protein